MTENTYRIPAIVDLTTVGGIVDDLRQMIGMSSAPGIDAHDVQTAGLPLVQLIVSAHRSASEAGKDLKIDAPPDGVLARLFDDFGIDRIDDPVAPLSDPMTDGALRSTERN